MLALAAMHPPFAVFRDQQRWVRFQHPEAVLAIHHAADLHSLLRRIDRALENHRFVAGYVGYDATAGLGLAAQPPLAAELPLAWSARFSTPRSSTFRPSSGVRRRTPGSPR